MRKIFTKRGMIGFLKEMKFRKRFYEKVIELVDVGVPNLWGHFKDVILKACDEMCGKRIRRRSKGETW